MNKTRTIIVLTIIIFALSIFILLKFVEPDYQPGTNGAASVSQETYIFVSMLWNNPVWQQAKYGGQQAEKFWNDNGGNIRVKFYGPTDGDTGVMQEALIRAINEKPTGIIYYDFESGGTEVLQQYYEEGGLVSSWVGVDPQGEWPVHHIGGIDNVRFGEEMAEWAMEIEGDEFVVGIMTVSDNIQHQQRVVGIRNVLDRYDGIDVIEPYVEETYTPEGAATNAVFFINEHPEVDVLLCTAAQSAGAMGRACKISGYGPKEKLIIGSDQDPDMITLMQEGYIHGSLGYSFAADIFSSITWMHLYVNQGISFTDNDKEQGLWAVPIRSIIPTIRFTKENAELMLGIPKADQ